MNFTMTKMRSSVHRGLAAVGLLAVLTAGNAYAGNVGISVGIHVPGAPMYYMPPPPPPPQVRYYQPAPPPVVYYAPAAPYGYWAPAEPRRGYGKHFKHRGSKHHRHHPHYGHR